MSTWLIVDANNLAWRSHYALKGLSHRGEPTAVLYGFLRDLIAFKGKFKADGCVVCFDLGKSLRLEVCPDYKGHRLKGALSREQLTELEGVRGQIRKLESVLPVLGFRNVFSQEGYEADDLIASVCHDSLSEGDEAVILGSDKDLLQLLSGQVSIWNYRKHVTLQSFWQDWQLEPEQWVDVKALAGCPTDGIKGIAGVGELTAARYLRGELKPGRVLDRFGRSENLGIWDRNRQLVELPWPGLKPFLLRDDEPDPDAWDRVCRKYGMDSLLGLLGRRKGVVR